MILARTFPAVGLLLTAVAAAAAGPVLVLEVDGPIGPIVSEYLADGLEEASEVGAELVVVRIDTPGGLLDATHDMTQAILNSEVPVAAFVGPDGARAASAGVFILTAAHVAAMAQATNAGAAHPVAVQGSMDSTMSEKVTNDAVAKLRAMAERRGRAGPWCDLVVRESVSVAADSALALGMVDTVVRDVAALLEWVDGRTFETPVGPRTPRVADAEPRKRGMSARQRFLRQITNPNVAYILMMLGVYGLFFELSRPGAILPGVVGGIAIILAVVSFQALPVNTAGVLLILLGMILLLLEIKITSHGILALGGVTALFLGSMMLFKADSPMGTVSLKVVVPTVVLSAGGLLLLAGMALRAQSRPVVTGLEGMIGRGAVVKTVAEEDGVYGGTAELFGELWYFTTRTPVTEGRRLIVRAVVDRVLHLEPGMSEEGESP